MDDKLLYTSTTKVVKNTQKYFIYDNLTGRDFILQKTPFLSVCDVCRGIQMYNTAI